MMNELHRIQSLLDEQLQRKQRELLVRKLVAALEIRFQIPRGLELVLLLGNGDELSNHEALRTWVGSELVTLDGLSPPEQLAQLEHRLAARLNAYADGW